MSPPSQLLLGMHRKSLKGEGGCSTAVPLPLAPPRRDVRGFAAKPLCRRAKRLFILLTRIPCPVSRRDCWSLSSASFGITSRSGSWYMGGSHRVPWRAARWDAAPCTPQQLPFPDPPRLTAICGVGISLSLSAAGPAPQSGFFLADLFIWVLHCSRPRLSFCCT